MKFKKGDTVRVVKPEGIVHAVMIDDSTSPAKCCWVAEMNDYVGAVFILDTFDSLFGWDATFTQNGNWFLEDWLEFYDNPVDTFDDAMSILN